MSRGLTPWHAAQLQRIEEGRARLARLPVRAQRMFAAELDTLVRGVDAILPSTVQRNGGVVPYLEREVDDLVAEIVVLADALERS